MRRGVGAGPEVGGDPCRDRSPKRRTKAGGRRVVAVSGAAHRQVQAASLDRVLERAAAEDGYRKNCQPGVARELLAGENQAVAGVGIFRKGLTANRREKPGRG